MSSPFKKLNQPPFKKGQSSPGGNGVLYRNQFPKNFLRPYGAVEQAPTEDVVFRRVSPASCEWLKRPKVAMSEMAETLSTNMDMLTAKKSKLLSSDGVAYAKKLKPLLQNLKHLNTKNRETPATKDHVKGILKCVVGADEQTDAFIDEAMEVGAALFLTATHLSVARTLFRNPDQYASAIDVTGKWASDFKKNANMRTLKTAIEKECCSKSSSSATATFVKPQRKRLLQELSSSEDSDSSDSSTSSSTSRSEQSQSSDTSHSQLCPKPAKREKTTKKLVPEEEQEEEDENLENEEEDEAEDFAEKQHQTFLAKTGTKKKSREQPKPIKKKKKKVKK